MSKVTLMVDLPGQHLEKGAVEMGAEFVKSISRVWTAKKAILAAPIEAKADEMRKDIEFEGDLRRVERREAARRKSEIEELEHRANLSRAALAIEELTREKNRINVLDVIVKSREKIEEDPPEFVRDVDSDWLLRFFQYAGEVDEDQLRSILAQGLSDASIVGKPIMSRRAIDVIRFFDISSLEQFKFAALYLSSYRQFSPSFFDFSLKNKPAGFNPVALEELGLIKTVQVKSMSATIGKFKLSITYAPNVPYLFTLYEFTKIGREIAGLIDPNVRKRFDDEGLDKSIDAIWDLQSSYMLSARDFECLAMSIVQDISSSYGIRFGLNYFPNEGHKSIFTKSTSRLKITDPIGDIGIKTQSFDAPLRMIEWAEAFFAEFSNFDYALDMMPVDASPLE